MWGVWVEVRAVRRLTIGRLAKRARVNVEAIRYDERCGPLPQPPQGASSYRQYSQDDVVSLQGGLAIFRYRGNYRTSRGAACVTW